MMRWAWLSNGEGFLGAGREDVYLISVDLHAGQTTGVRVTRWRSRPNPDAWETALDASRNTIAFPLRIPRLAGDLEVAVLLDDAKCLVGKYESGEPLEGHPAWQSPPRPQPVIAGP